VHIGAGIASFFTRQHTIRLWGERLCSTGNINWNFDMFNNDADRREFISSGAAVGGWCPAVSHGRPGCTIAMPSVRGATWSFNCARKLCLSVMRSHMYTPYHRATVCT
jgi:hypothetical protein